MTRVYHRVIHASSNQLADKQWQLEMSTWQNWSNWYEDKLQVRKLNNSADEQTHEQILSPTGMDRVLWIFLLINISLFAVIDLLDSAWCVSFPDKQEKQDNDVMRCCSRSILSKNVLLKHLLSFYFVLRRCPTVLCTYCAVLGIVSHFWVYSDIWITDGIRHTVQLSLGTPKHWTGRVQCAVAYFDPAWSVSTVDFIFLAFSTSM